MTSAVDGGVVGLEDFESANLTAPRLKIDHRQGVFVNTLTKEVFPYLDAILLGLIKQRVYFDKDVEDDSEPFCKSPDGVTGYPNQNPKKPQYNFPWAQSGFDPNAAAVDDLGRRMLDCAACPFAQWDEDRKPPPCSEQYTVPMVYNDSPDPAVWNDAMGILSFQKSSMKPITQYVSDFMGRRAPLFTVITRIELAQQSRGQVVYATPVFTKGTALDISLLPRYAETFEMMRGYLRKPPRPVLALGAAQQRPAITTGGYVPQQPVPQAPQQQYVQPQYVQNLSVPVPAAPAPAQAAPAYNPAQPQYAAPAPAPVQYAQPAPGPVVDPWTAADPVPDPWPNAAAPAAPAPQAPPPPAPAPVAPPVPTVVEAAPTAQPGPVTPVAPAPFAAPPAAVPAPAPAPAPAFAAPPPPPVPAVPAAPAPAPVPSVSQPQAVSPAPAAPAAQPAAAYSDDDLPF